MFKTHASITAGLSKMVEQLETLKNEQVAKIKTRMEKIKKAEQEIKVSEVEMKKATNTISKLRDIVG